jgi:hypothetical protein
LKISDIVWRGGETRGEEEEEEREGGRHLIVETLVGSESEHLADRGHDVAD